MNPKDPKYPTPKTLEDLAELKVRFTPPLQRSLARARSTVCPKEKWCNRQRGHAGECAPAMMADGSVKL